MGVLEMLQSAGSAVTGAVANTIGSVGGSIYGAGQTVTQTVTYGQAPTTPGGSPYISAPPVQASPGARLAGGIIGVTAIAIAPRPQANATTLGIRDQSAMMQSFTQPIRGGTENVNREFENVKNAAVGLVAAPFVLAYEAGGVVGRASYMKGRETRQAITDFQMPLIPRASAMGGTQVLTEEQFYAGGQPPIPRGGVKSAGADFSNKQLQLPEQEQKKPSFFMGSGGGSQTEIENVSQVYVDRTSGEFAAYQQRPDRPGITNRMSDIVASGGRAAAQSGQFSFAPLTTNIRDQATGKLKPGYNPDIEAHPEKYSRPGAEYYGGVVQPLVEGNRPVPDATLSTYPANTYNLASLVSPTGVNIPKSQYSGANIPYTIRATSPIVQYVDTQGVVRGVTPPQPNLPGYANAAIPSPGISGGVSQRIQPPAQAPQASLANILGIRTFDELQMRVGMGVESVKQRVPMGLESSAGLIIASVIEPTTGWNPLYRESSVATKYNAELKQAVATRDTAYGNVEVQADVLAGIQRGNVNENGEWVGSQADMNKYNVAVDQYNTMVSAAESSQKNIGDVQKRGMQAGAFIIERGQYVQNPDAVDRYGQYSVAMRGVTKGIQSSLGFTSEQYRAYEGVIAAKPESPQKWIETGIYSSSKVWVPDVGKVPVLAVQGAALAATLAIGTEVVGIGAARLATMSAAGKGGTVVSLAARGAGTLYAGMQSPVVGVAAGGIFYGASVGEKTDWFKRSPREIFGAGTETATEFAFMGLPLMWAGAGLTAAEARFGTPRIVEPTAPRGYKTEYFTDAGGKRQTTYTKTETFMDILKKTDPALYERLQTSRGGRGTTGGGGAGGGYTGFEGGGRGGIEGRVAPKTPTPAMGMPQLPSGRGEIPSPGVSPVRPSTPTTGIPTPSVAGKSPMITTVGSKSPAPSKALLPPGGLQNVAPIGELAGSDKWYISRKSGYPLLEPATERAIISMPQQKFQDFIVANPTKFTTLETEPLYDIAIARGEHRLDFIYGTGNIYYNPAEYAMIKSSKYDSTVSAVESGASILQRFGGWDQEYWAQVSPTTKPTTPTGNKMYITFKSLTDFTPESGAKFVGDLKTNAWSGQFKIPRSGHDAAGRFENIVVYEHAPGGELSKSLQVARGIWGDKIDIAYGKDVGGRSSTQIRIDELRATMQMQPHMMRIMPTDREPFAFKIAKGSPVWGESPLAKTLIMTKLETPSKYPYTGAVVTYDASGKMDSFTPPRRSATTYSKSPTEYREWALNWKIKQEAKFPDYAHRSMKMNMQDTIDTIYNVPAPAYSKEDVAASFKKKSQFLLEPSKQLVPLYRPPMYSVSTVRSVHTAGEFTDIGGSQTATILNVGGTFGAKTTLGTRAGGKFFLETKQFEEAKGAEGIESRQSFFRIESGKLYGREVTKGTFAVSAENIPAIPESGITTLFMGTPGGFSSITQVISGRTFTIDQEFVRDLRVPYIDTSIEVEAKRIPGSALMTGSVEGTNVVVRPSGLYGTKGSAKLTRTRRGRGVIETGITAMELTSTSTAKTERYTKYLTTEFDRAASDFLDNPAGVIGAKYPAAKSYIVAPESKSDLLPDWLTKVHVKPITIKRLKSKSKPTVPFAPEGTPSAKQVTQPVPPGASSTLISVMKSPETQATAGKSTFTVPVKARLVSVLPPSESASIEATSHKTVELQTRIKGKPVSMTGVKPRTKTIGARTTPGIVAPKVSQKTPKAFITSLEYEPSRKTLFEHLQRQNPYKFVDVYAPIRSGVSSRSTSNQENIVGQRSGTRSISKYETKQSQEQRGREETRLIVMPTRAVRRAEDVTVIPDQITRMRPITVFPPITPLQPVEPVPQPPQKVPPPPIIPPLGLPPGGGGSSGGGGYRGAYQFREHSPTWTPAEMGMSLFTGSFRRIPRRAIQQSVKVQSTKAQPTKVKPIRAMIKSQPVPKKIQPVRAARAKPVRQIRVQPSAFARSITTKKGRYKGR